MNRADLLAYAASQFDTLLKEARMTPADDAAGLKYPLDLAEAAFGSDYASISTGAAYALVDYHVINRIAKSMAARVDVQTTGFSQGAGAQVFPRLKAMLDEAKERVESYGYAVGGDPSLTDGSGIYTINLDFIEPVCYGDLPVES